MGSELGGGPIFLLLGSATEAREVVLAEEIGGLAELAVVGAVAETDEGVVVNVFTIFGATVGPSSSSCTTESS